MSLKQALFYMIKQFPIVYIDCAVYSQLSNPFSKTSFSKTQVFWLSWKGAVYFS